MNWRLLIISSPLAITSIFQMGYTNAYPNTAITGFRKYLNASHSPPMQLTNSEFEWIWSGMLAVYFIGFSIGSIITASVADRIGRKCTLCLGNFGGLLSAIIALFGIFLNMPMLFGLSRLVMSLSAGISMNALILLFQESSPTNMKGLISFNGEMSFVVTNLVGGLCGMKFVLGDNLAGLIGISIVPSAIACLLSTLLKESPKYLYLKQNDPDGAARSLKFYQNLKDDEENMKFLNELKMEQEESNLKNDTIFDILTTQPHRRGFLLGVATMQLTASIWPIIFYSTDFLIDVGFSFSFAEIVSTTMLFISTFSTFIGMFAVELFSRKWLLIITAILNVTSLLVFSLCVYFQKKLPGIEYGCVVTLITHGISYSVAMGPIAWFITSELVPMNCRAISQSLVLAVNHFVSLIIAFLTFPLYKTMGPLILVIFYVVPGVICIQILIKYLPETKDKHINEVVEELKK